MKIKSIYIANDGTEFTTENECRDYEETTEKAQKREQEKKAELEALNVKMKNIVQTYDESIAALEVEIAAFEKKYEGIELHITMNDEIVEIEEGIDFGDWVKSVFSIVD